ncbi:MAG: prolyl oligopeptidase family serine peptidase [Candidatus Aminicenantes bacterium]|nr:prolyl oligopeptidase family serine peptidase [Candidatus Aminicenantes bacterium]
MRQKSSLRSFLFIVLFSGIVLISFSSQSGQKKALTFQDIMKFKEIHDPVISEDGLWLAYNAQPDRGDGEVAVHGIKNGEKFIVECGSRPLISKGSKWVAMVVKPKAVDLEKAKKDKPKEGMALLETSTGKIFHYERVQSFAFSEDSKWIAYLHHKEEEKPKKEGEKAPEEKEKVQEEKKEKEKKKTGSLLVLYSLGSGKEVKIPNVLSYSFDKSSQFLAYVLASQEGVEDGIYTIDLAQESLPQSPIVQQEDGIFAGLTWVKEGSRLAFLASTEEGKDKTDGYFSLWIWNGQTGEKTPAAAADSVPEGWMIPEKNQVSWSKDGKRLFFGLKPEEIHQAMKKAEKKEGDGQEKEIDLFDTDEILNKREVDVWHWNDPFIKTHEKNIWPRVKDQTYLTVYHVGSDRFVQLADQDMPRVNRIENSDFALGYSDVPYRKQVTWYGRLEDIYLVNLMDGTRQKVASRLEDHSSLSPSGRYVLYYEDKNWHMFDGKTEDTRNLTEKMNVPFFDEDKDYPSKVPSYGMAGWLEDESGVLVYDKYDIWQFPTRTGEPRSITGGKGREGEMTFRVLRLDPKRHFIKKDEKLLLSAYHNIEKHFGFYSCQVGKSVVVRLLEERKKFIFLAKAKEADVLIYTRESFEEFPDIWVSNGEFSLPKRISDVNPQISEFAWGSPELVEWNSLDGIPLQGVLIKPANYEEGKRYPVIVYFYRFFSQRLHEFNQMVINHRPNFPFYTSNGYALFLPDIRFDVGHPGYAATKCLVPGVQKLMDMGIADPKAIGLHGHSWSGYQTAFVITQTNIFAAAVAGAPVSNMTSAYSGIRWESGLARQFQYEKDQSRIGGSLWEYPERYIENSPVFFADRIKTPLLIQFGDEDGAVPWYQGIELYLAMRRLGKDCVFLQYRGEPHHLQKYANKLDYSIKMNEYFDHYLKGMPAPEWITNGIPYRGK